MNRWLRTALIAAQRASQFLFLAATMVILFVIGANLSQSPSSYKNPPSDRDPVRSERQKRFDQAPQATDKSVKEKTPTPGDAERRSARQLQLFGWVVLVCSLNTSVMMWLIARANSFGIRLMASAFTVFFACMTLMPQVEVWFFLKDPWPVIRMALILGVTVTLPFSIVSVVVMGKLWGKSIEKKRLNFHPGLARWFPRLAVVAVLYAVIYTLFGYFVAWQNPELRRLYSGSDEKLGFLAHLVSEAFLFRVLPLQLVRGLLWGALCGLIIRIQRGRLLITALLVASALSVLMNSQLLLPNPMMPPGIRITHLIETATSNFVFGLIAVWVLGGGSQMVEPRR